MQKHYHLVVQSQLGLPMSVGSKLASQMSSSCPAMQTLRQRVKNWLLGQVQMLFFKLSVLPRMKSESW